MCEFSWCSPFSATAGHMTYMAQVIGLFQVLLISLIVVVFFFFVFFLYLTITVILVVFIYIFIYIFCISKFLNPFLLLFSFLFLFPVFYLSFGQLTPLCYNLKSEKDH